MSMIRDCKLVLLASVVGVLTDKVYVSMSMSITYVKSCETIELPVKA